MKMIKVTPLVLLGIFLCSTIGKGLGIEFVDKSTCLKLQQKAVRLNQLKSYTKQTIPMEAILFVTRKGKELCADPRMNWVKKAVAALDSKAQNQQNNNNAPNIKKPSGKNEKGKQKNKQNTKRNKKNVPRVQPSKTTPSEPTSVMKS